MWHKLNPELQAAMGGFTINSEEHSDNLESDRRQHGMERGVSAAEFQIH